jgi:hypothetical protein
VNNGTYAAMTLGDAMSRQSSGSFAECADQEPAETAAYVSGTEGGEQ